MNIQWLDGPTHTAPFTDRGFVSTIIALPIDANLIRPGRAAGA
jgi:hypothetical protein